MRKLLLFTALILLNIFFTRGQGQNYNWYFGNGAGVNFPAGSSPVSSSPALLYTEEGCSSVSDANGNLLFYTNGVDVWNRNHTLMPNGFGLNGGTGSSTQSCIIIRQPGSTSIYYIFTVDEDAGAFGFRYSTVDMSLSGTFGDVVLKNVPIHSSTCEKIAATYHCNGTDIWIATHDMGTNIYRAVLLTTSGIGSVVTSAIGPAITSGFPGGNGMGTLKFSANGQYAALSNQASPALLDLLDFNSSTGVFSNRKALYTASEGTELYGLEFSPNSNILYVSNHNELSQYDITSGVAATIIASRTVLGSSSVGGNIAQLQLGPDGKIYSTQTRTTMLGVINSPNTIGVGCSWVELFLDIDPLATGTIETRFGLPSQLLFLPTAFTYPYGTSNSVSYCQGDPVDPIPSFVSSFPVTGSFTSTAGLIINSTTGEIDLSASSTGTYTVTFSTAVPSSCISPFTSSYTVTITPSATLCFTKEAAKWYMGNNIGLNFLCSSPPSILNDGAVNSTQPEGGVSISDANGDLLFYVFDSRARDKNHNIMPNGLGVNCDESSSQGGVAVKNLTNPNKYYVFSVLSATGGLYYSEIDMSLNFGLGDVVAATKNTLLLPGVGEQITAVENCQGTGTWIIVHSANNMYAYLVTASGIAAPVVSPIPTILQYVGQLSASPTGRHIAYSTYNGGASLYTFNNETGEICFKENLSFGGYGNSFSNNGKYLYVHDMFSGLYQYDVSSATVNSTSVFIGMPFVFGTMQLGPDCKLYLFGLGQSMGSVINFPNNAGTTCDFQPTSFPVSNIGAVTQYGLPNYIQSWFKDPTYTDPVIDADFVFTSVCYPNPISFTNTSATITECPPFLWNFGDPASGVNNTSTLENPSHAFSSPGTYTVTLTVNERCQTSVQTYNVVVPGPPSIIFSGDTTVCENFDVVLSANGAASYSWTGPSWIMGGLSSTNDTITNPGSAIDGQANEGWYYVEATSADGCITNDSIFVNILAVPDVSISATAMGCYTHLEAIINSSNGPVTSYEWTVSGVPPILSTTNDVDVNPSSTSQYLVFVNDAEGCGAGALVLVSPLPTTPAPLIYTPNAWYCIGDNLTPITSSNGDIWYSDAALTTVIGSGVSIIPAVIPGVSTYYVVDTSGGCVSAAASVQVEFSNCSYPCSNNLLLNGDFEDFSSCPTAVGQINNATTWGGSFADYYNCGFYAYPDFTPPFIDPIFGIFTNPQGTGYIGVGLNGNSFVSGGASTQIHLDSCIAYTLQFRASTPRSENDPTNVLCVYGSNTPDPFAAGCGGASATQLACLTLPSDIDPTWQIYTLTFTPPADFDYLVFAGGCPAPTAHGGWIMLDDVFLCGDCINPPVISFATEISPETCAGNDGEANVNVSGCNNSFTYNWYDISSPGTTVSTSQNPTNLTAGAYEIIVTDGNNCKDTASVTISSIPLSSPVTTFSYDEPFCIGSTNPLPDTAIGFTTGGIFSSSSGLIINPSSGEINLTLSTPGTYTVLYTFSGTACVGSGSSSYIVNITNAPSASFSYTDSIVCSSEGIIPVVFVGSTGGNFSSTGGLNLNNTNGEVNASLSSAGTYTITYSIPSTGGCPAVAVTANITIEEALNASISYTPATLCTGTGTVPVNLSGSIGGVFSSSSGITIDPATGTINTNSSTPGNYYILYSVSSTGTCPSFVDSTFITINTIPTATLTGDSLMCSGETITLTASGGSSFLWSDGSTGSSINVSPASDQTYSVIVSNGPCVDTSAINIAVQANPTITALANPYQITSGDSTQLSVVTNGTSVVWSPSTSLSCSTCINPMASPEETIIYSVTSTLNGCSATDTVLVRVEELCKDLFIPDAFSPNNDQNNDVWCVYGSCLSEIEVAVFDRWGNKVFFSTETEICWTGEINGVMADNGVFIYQLHAITNKGEEIKLNGSIYLIK